MHRAGLRLPVGLIPAMLVLALVLLAPGAGAHQDGFLAGQVFLGTLPPGAEETFGLAPPTGPLPAGLLLVINAVVYEGTAAPEVALQLRNATVFRWPVAPGQVTRHLAAVTPEPGNYVLAIRNPGPGPVRLGFFYDVACDCPAKPLPVAVPNGVLVFPLDVTPGAWAVNVTEPAVHRIDPDVAQFDSPGATTWPDGFHVVVNSSAGRAHAEHRVPWKAPEGGLFYLVARSAHADLGKLDLSSPSAQNFSTLVATRFVRVGDAPRPSASTPAPEALAVVAAAALGAAWARARNG